MNITDTIVNDEFPATSYRQLKKLYFEVFDETLSCDINFYNTDHVFSMVRM